MKPSAITAPFCIKTTLLVNMTKCYFRNEKQIPIIGVKKQTTLKAW